MLIAVLQSSRTDAVEKSVTDVLARAITAKGDGPAANCNEVESGHVRSLLTITRFLPHACTSQILIIPLSKPVSAKEHDLELPLEIFRSDFPSVVVLDVPRAFLD
jgi:hypothetical protein